MHLASTLRTLRNGFSIMKERTLLKMEGTDAFKFLQGLTTNDLQLLQKNPSIYTAFLNTQGRVLADAFIYSSPSSPSSPSFPSPPSSPALSSFLIDCHGSIAEDLLQHFKKLKLRSKFELKSISDQCSVWTVFGKDNAFKSLNGKEITTCVVDPRLGHLGLRVVLPNNSELTSLPSNFVQVSSEIYHMNRIRWGIPEGPIEIPTGSALPLEYNIELANGVSFTKGCYLGQELTARTHFTGLLRKRIFPVMMVNENNNNNEPEDADTLFPKCIIENLSLKIPENGSALSVESKEEKKEDARARTTDKLIAGLNDVGLAMLRFEHLNIASLNNTPLVDSSNRVMKILIPFWWTKEKDKIEKSLK